ncbi:MAG: SET domain-containing protein-lysine N-methyltransferase [Nanoarchaeota archaeon]|nr:SET domain-containing protein-lysine N-methyltransferase [Nanoarchaeota archaeon]
MDIELEKRISKINGFGIFTKKTITKDSKFYQIPLNIVYSQTKPRCARIANNKYVSDDKVLNWINHSCDPNSKLDITEKNPLLIAIRDISQNEEITVDYNQTELGGTPVKCTCKSENCKGYFNTL